MEQPGWGGVIPTRAPGARSWPIKDRTARKSVHRRASVCWRQRMQRQTKQPGRAPMPGLFRSRSDHSKARARSISASQRIDRARFRFEHAGQEKGVITIPVDRPCSRMCRMAAGALPRTRAGTGACPRDRGDLETIVADRCRALLFRSRRPDRSRQRIPRCRDGRHARRSPRESP
jgi:hypothetical protein